MQNILIVDDDESTLEAMSDVLDTQGYSISSTTSGEEALELMSKQTFDVILTDMKMPDVDGLDILESARRIEPQPQVIVITGYGSVDKAVEFMRAGASDFVEKPVKNLAELRAKVSKAIENQSLRRENIALQQQNVALQRQIHEKFGFSNIIGNSKAMYRIFDQLKLVAPTKANVLICGETGTGKDLIAKAIHNNSPRKDKPFLPINCSAISSSLLESELFGHDRGAFTGAIRQRSGAFEMANGGTMLLDEVGEMSLEIQAKFLRVVEDQKFMRLGGTAVEVDVRIISATNKDLSKEVEKRMFREDLYYRLKVVTIEVPPLRDRKTDIPLMVNAFLKEFSVENNKTVVSIDRAAMERMVNYSWPGNVRELRNVIESMVVMSTSDRIEMADLPSNMRDEDGADSSAAINVGMSMNEVEREIIRKTLEETAGNRTRAAEILKIGLRTLHRKIEKYGLA